MQGSSVCSLITYIKNLVNTFCRYQEDAWDTIRDRILTVYRKLGVNVYNIYSTQEKAEGTDGGEDKINWLCRIDENDDSIGEQKKNKEEEDNGGLERLSLLLDRLHIPPPPDDAVCSGTSSSQALTLRGLLFRGKTNLPAFVSFI